MRKLIYLGGSPYARKVRIVLAELGLTHEAVQASMFPPADDVAAINPCLQVPAFVDGDVELFDSNLIIEYLLATYSTDVPDMPSPPLATTMTRSHNHWDDAKLLATIETLADTIVSLSYLDWCGMAAEGRNAVGMDLVARQHERIQSCLDWLDTRATPEGFIPGLFSIQDIALICPLMWNEARNAYLWRGRPNLEAIYARYAERASVVATTVIPWKPDD
jgi:glutathione S-transferase